MARHVHVERIRTKTPTKFRAWPPRVLASNTVNLVLADVDAIIVKIITTKTLTVASKIETRNQSLVESVDVAAHANPKRTNLESVVQRRKTKVKVSMCCRRYWVDSVVFVLQLWQHCSSAC